MNSCPLMSPERFNELLSHLPPIDGTQWGNREVETTARIVHAILRECGLGPKDMNAVGQTLSRFCLP